MHPITAAGPDNQRNLLQRFTRSQQNFLEMDNKDDGRLFLQTKLRTNEAWTTSQQTWKQYKQI